MSFEQQFRIWVQNNEKNIDWYWLSENPNITWDIVIKNPDKNWNWALRLSHKPQHYLGYSREESK